ncbi:MAG: YggS family pyridoxal phosphate-dependent enzyme, partial [Myxococcales bacterium]|nr:YggS family pyridoxal phosphate-dependent enzyme [Myxococcales bacterium]
MNLDLAENLDRVRERIERACDRAGRDPSSVELVAVSKAHSEQLIRAAYDAGLRVFGENYAQELAEKADALRDLKGLRWRFIGHLQRNKIKLVERARATVDTVDSIRLAEALSARAEAGGYSTEALIQVNVGEEAQKSGCTPKELPSLVEGVQQLPGLALRGLMTVAPHFDDPKDARPCFAALRRLAEHHG